MVALLIACSLGGATTSPDVRIVQVSRPRKGQLLSTAGLQSAATSPQRATAPPAAAPTTTSLPQVLPGTTPAALGGVLNLVPPSVDPVPSQPAKPVAARPRRCLAGARKRRQIRATICNYCPRQSRKPGRRRPNCASSNRRARTETAHAPPRLDTGAVGSIQGSGLAACRRLSSAGCHAVHNAGCAEGIQSVCPITRRSTDDTRSGYRPDTPDGPGLPSPARPGGR